MSSGALQSELLKVSAAYPDWFAHALSQPREQGEVEVDGTAIRFYRWGDPNLPGVVFTHGFMAHARCWAFISPLLERFCCVAFDLSGMGDSGWRERYDVANRAAEPEAVARAAGFTSSAKPALICHSYGGSVGMTAVEANPDFWSQLIVCDMTMLAPGEPSQFEDHRARRKARGVRPHRVHDTYEAAAGRFRLAPEQPCDNEYLMQYMAYHSLQQTPAGWCWKFDPRIMGPDDERDPNWWQSIVPRFIELKVPTALVVGALSEMLSARAEAHIRAAQPLLPIIKIPDARHHVMLDQPLALLTALDALLQR